MSRISGFVRRALLVPVLVAPVVLGACGSETEGGAEPTETPTESGSPSPDDSTEPASGEPGSHADGECGGGEVETTVVEAADGVQLTAPADWQVEVAAQGSQVGLYPPERDSGDGFIVVEDTGQTLDEAVRDALEFTADSAETTSEQDLDLEGFDGARLLTFEYDDSDRTFSVDLVAVTDDGLRVVANMTREVADEQPLVESCLSTLSRTS
jgi:hypothetical protein